MTRPIGVEPITSWSVVKRSIQLSYGRKIIYGAEDRNRTGTVISHRRILSPVRLPVPPPRHLAPRVGLEPTAYRLTAECSTIELPRNITTLMSGVRFLKFDYFFENLMFSMSDASNEEIFISIT